MVIVVVTDEDAEPDSSVMGTVFCGAMVRREENKDDKGPTRNLEAKNFPR